MTNPTCFVIGPIGSELAPLGTPEREAYEIALEIYANVIQPACRAAGMEPLRADEIQRSGEIPEQIIRHLRDDPFVVADVSGGNANVMYELGIRHATGKCTLLIGEYGRLPFDVSVIRAHQFVRTPAGMIEARRRLTAALVEAKASGCDPTTAGRLLAAIIDQAERTATGHGSGTSLASSLEESADPERLTAEMSDEDQPGFLEILADSEAALPAAGEKLTELTELMQRGLVIAQEGTEAMSESDAAGRGSVGKLLAVRSFADKFRPISERAEQLAADYEADMKKVDAGMSYLLDRLEQEPGLIHEAGDFPRSLLRWAKVTEDVTPSIETLSASTDELGRADRQLRPTTRRYARALRSVAASSKKVAGWADRMRGVLETSGRTPGEIDAMTVDS
jgi:hypothetical protein